MTDNKQAADLNEMLHLATDIVAAYVSNNKSTAEEIPELLHTTYATLNALNEGGAGGMTNREPAVPVSKSITPDYVICLEDGKKTENAEALYPDTVWSDTGRIPPQMGPAC